MGSFAALVLLLCSVLVHASSNASEPKRLSAGILLSKLKARGEFTVPLLSQESSFYYIADDVEEESVFSATLDVKSQWPILVLEDLEAGLDSVSCEDSEIRLEFASTVAEESFKTAIGDTPEFVIVTSHAGCDPEGERSAHRVTEVSVDPKSHIIILYKARMDWHDAFSSTRVSFRRRHPSEIQRRGPTAVKRQQTATQASTPTESFPAAPSKVDGLNSSADTSFDELHTDLEIYPLDIPLADEVVPQLPVVVRCRTCSLEGSIELSQGQFSVGRDADDEGNDADFELDEAIGFFSNSSVELAVNRLSSQIELELELSSKGPLLELTTSLPTIPLTPFQIAGVLTFGPQIVPNIIITADLEGDVGFSYGFNVRVPDNSKVSIQIPDFGDSEITGFEDTEFETIPFEASTEVTSVALSIAFQPQILLGISTGLDFMNVNLDGGIGAFVSLPNLSLNVSQVTGVNENCDVVTGEDDVVGDAIHLAPSVELDMGVIASYDVRLGAFNDSRATAPVLASTSYSLPTGCVSFEPDVHESDRADSSSSGGTGGDNGDGGNSAASAKGVSGVTLICAVVLSTVAAGFCSWA
ncbi:putative GPI anchored protein [Aspergillus undulatus]|uniref:putative GPI anchored protein n=1 Tax=Aspergillus undulatus TaxID=1810928 RepID=UPI003CCD5D3E